MRKLITLVLVLLTLVPQKGKAQINWKDSLDPKLKVIDAFYQDSLVYFINKKGMGVYSPKERMILLQPIYAFVKKAMFNNAVHYLFVQKNKVGLITADNKIVIPAKYNKLGVKEVSQQWLMIYDDQFKYNPFHSTGTEFDLLNEISLACNDGKIIVNDFVLRDDPVPYRTLIGDIFVDSVDAKGKTVYMHYQDKCNSGVFDNTKKVWIMEGKAKVNLFGQSFLARYRNAKKEFIDRLETYALDGSPLGNIPFDLRHSKQSVRKLLSSYEPILVDSVFFSQSESLYYTFKAKDKFGLYNAERIAIEILPATYDFIAKANAFDDYVFVADKNLSGIYSVKEHKEFYPPIYPQITLYSMPFMEEEFLTVTCGSDELEFPTYMNITPGYELELKSMTNPNKRHAGLQAVDGKMILHDFVPMGPESTEPYHRYLYDGTRIDSVLYKNGQVYFDENGSPWYVYPPRAPAKIKGSVFDLSQMKWIIPARQSKIQITENLISTHRYSNDSLYFSCYSLSGKPVFENVKEKEFLENQTYIRQWIGNSNFKGNVDTDVFKGGLTKKNEYKAMHAIGDNSYYGIYDFLRMKFTLPMNYSYVHFDPMKEWYVLVDTNLVGLSHGEDGEWIPVKYTSIHWVNDKFILNDTLAYQLPRGFYRLHKDSVEFVNEIVKSAKYKRDDFSVVLYKDYLLFKDIDYVSPDEVDPHPLNIRSIDSTYSCKVDLKSKKPLAVKKMWNMFDWHEGYIGVNRKKELCYAVPGGNTKVVFSTADSVLRGKNVLAQFELDSSFSFNRKGELLRTTKVDQTYFDGTYQFVGYKYTYFNGQQYSKPPVGFVTQAMNNAGLLLCYTIATDQKTNLLVKKYYYYDPSTHTTTPVELQLSNGILKVFPVDGAFVLMDYNPMTKKINCTVLDEDLKTVKSEFKDNIEFKVYPSFGLNQPPLYYLRNEKEYLCFDKEFQFAFRVSKVDEIERKLEYNRFIFKVGRKSYKYDWQGNLKK